MTTYSAITTGQIDADSIIDTVVAGQWSNNLIAVIEGDASASGARIAGDSAMTAITAGSSYRHTMMTTVGVLTSLTTWTRLDSSEVVIQRTGSYQVKFDAKVTNTLGGAASRLYRNASTGYSGDVAFGTSHTLTTGFVTYTETLSLNAGDILVIYGNDSGGAYDHTYQNLIIESAVKPFG